MHKQQPSKRAFGSMLDAALGSGLITMYGTVAGGTVPVMYSIRSMTKKIVDWNAIVRCYGMHGLADEALKMFTGLLTVGYTRMESYSYVCCLHVLF